MKTKIATGIIAIVALFIAGITITQQNTMPEHIVLGVILPLTGDAASYGEHARNAVELVKEKAEKDFGVVFDVRYEDSQIKPALAASAAQKLISVDGVDYLIGFSSGETLAVCPIAESAKKIFLSSGSSPAITQCGEYTFRDYPSDIFQGKALAEKVYAAGFDKIALVYITNDYGVGLKDEFKKNFKGTILAEEGHAPQTRDFRTSIAKFKSQKPEAIVLTDQIAEASRFLDQLREQSVVVPVFGSEALKDDVLIKETKPEALQNLFVLFTTTYNGPEAENFKDAYIAKFGKESGAFADYVYDNVLLLASAVKKCDSKQTECIKNELYTAKFTGATGEIAFDQNGDVQNKSYELYKIENGVFIPFH